MNESIDYFDVLCHVTNAMGSTARYEELLDLVVCHAVEAMDGKGAALFLEDEDACNGHFEIVAQTGLSEEYQHSEPLSVQTFIELLEKEGGALSITDATTDPRIQNHEIKKAEGVVSMLVVPVMVKNRIVGVLKLYTAEKRVFSDKDIALLKALAQQGGAAIGYSRLVHRIVDYEYLFRSIAANISSTLDVNKILHILTFDVCESLNLKGALIRLLDEDSDELKLVATYGLSEEFLNKGPIHFKKGFEKIINGENILIQDVTDSNLLQYPEAAVQEGITSIFSVPVKAGDTVIGVMNFYGAGNVRFTKSMQQMAEALAIQGGIAIRNASQYLKLHEAKESLEQDIWGYRSWF